MALNNNKNERKMKTVTEYEYFRHIEVYSERLIGDDHYAALSPYLFTVAIHVGRIGDMIGYDGRWCYHDSASAKAALDAWEQAGFQGEPEGWHRRPVRWTMQHHLGVSRR